MGPRLLQAWRVSLRLHWRAGLGLAGVVLATGALATWATPDTWRVDAELLVNEPVAMHRLANPFSAVPSQPEELLQLPELLTSRARVVALVKRTNLLDTWDASRPWPLRLKDRLQQALLGAPSEADRLEALVTLLQQRLLVVVKQSHIYIGLAWPDPQVALRIVESSVASLEEQRETREVRALTEAALALDEQLAGLKVELRSHVEGLEAERTRARYGALEPSTDADREQLARDRERASQLLVRAEEKHISAEVMHRANALRFLPLQPPRLPREPEGPGLVVGLLVALLAAALTGLLGAVGLGLLRGSVLSGRQAASRLGLAVLGALRARAPPTTRPEAGLRALAAVAAVAVATGLALGASRGTLWVTLLPLGVVLGCWTLWRVPPRWPLLALMLLAVTVDDPNDRPYVGLWQSPLWSVGRVFFTNIAWFTGFELCVMGLCVLWLLKTWWHTGEGSRVRVAAPLRVAVWVSFATVVWLIALGMARGGNFREALWQFRAMLMLPALTALAFWALEFPRDLPALLKVLAVGSVVKAALGTYFVYGVITVAGQAPPHTTGHNDTMVLVSAAAVSLLLLWERPTQRHLLLALVWLPVVFLALKLNDRRIAYVDLAFAVLFVYLASPKHRVKRFVGRAAVAMVLPLVLYAAAGWNVRYGGVFAPVQKLRSIVDPDEETQAGASSVERDIENYNILRSWEQNQLLGQGFGHAFREFTPSFDFRQSGFGHVGHNSVLWLWWIAGPLGFTGALAYLVVGLYLLRRSLAVSTAWRERVALFTSLSILVTFLMQGFGDMGFVSLQFTFFVAAALAIAGQLSTRLGVLRPAALPPSPAQVPAASTAQVSPSPG